MAEEQPVVIDLASTVERDGEQEVSTNRVDGSLIAKGNHIYVRYHEEIEDTGEIRNVLKSSGDEMTIIRNGAVAMHQRFREGEMTEGHYETSFGTLHMQTETRQLTQQWHETAGQGEINVTYRLILAGRDVGEVTLQYTIWTVDES